MIVNGYEIEPNADLRRANFDYSVFPLWCGSFGFKSSERIVWQLIYHINRIDISDCNEEIKEAIACLDPYKNKFCEHREDVDKI